MAFVSNKDVKKFLHLLSPHLYFLNDINKPRLSQSFNSIYFQIPMPDIFSYLSILKKLNKFMLGMYLYSILIYENANVKAKWEII